MEFGTLNFSGLASGIDTKALIDAILQVERQPIKRLEERQATLNGRKTALDEMRTKLNAFLTSLRDISSAQSLHGKVTTVSVESILSASAGTVAETGNYAIDVQSLATAHKVAGNGVTAADEGLVGNGTITIQSGSRDPITIDVSAANGNNSLNAIRDAINAADAGVGASVLFDGTNYRLVVSAEETGAANGLTINDSTGLRLDDPLNEVSAAADAQLKVDGIDVTSSSNSVSGVIQGVTLDLAATGVVTVQVANDVEGVTEAIQSVVESYNEAIGFFNSQLDLDDPGPLANDTSARRLQLDLQRFVTSGVSGLPFGAIRSLSSIGVSFDGRSSELSVDSAELAQVLEERFDDVVNLFDSAGSASDSRIQLLGGSSAISGDYAVEITQAAALASVAGESPIRPQGLRRDETLTITVNGLTVDADLLKHQTIDEVVDSVNAALDTGGLQATAINDNGTLRISTDQYGSDQTITVVSDRFAGGGQQTGFRETPTSDTGQDVAGRIGGVDASGAGQVLSGADAAAGISLLVTATAADVTATGGDFGTVSVSSGFARPLITELTEATRFGAGRIDSAKDGIDDQLKRLSSEVLRLEERIVGREALLIRTFAAAEQAIAGLQAQQSQLASFL